MTDHCPNCSAALDPAAIPPSNEGDGLHCPHCGGHLPDVDAPTSWAVAPLRTDEPIGFGIDAVDPAPSPDIHPPALLHLWKSTHRKILLLGAAALLLLGGLVFFIASHKSGKASTTELNTITKTEVNEYFNKLIEEGRTTKRALDGIADVEEFGGTFIGLTKESLPWREAEALAKRTGGGILDLSQLGTARQEIINWLGRAHPDTLGKTTWILDGAEPLGIDSPDFGPVSTLDRPRRAFVFWPGNIPTGWEWAIKPKFDEALPFENGVARVRIGEKWELIDASGKEVHPPAFDFIGEFTEHGCAPIYQGESGAIETLRQAPSRSWLVGMPGPEVPIGVTCGLIDRTGKVLAKAEWEDVQNHINGFTPVKQGDKWGYLDPDGKLAIPCEWDDAWRFSAEGFAVVIRVGKRGIIDRTGKIIVQPEWDGAFNFCKEGIGAVRRGKGWSLVDASGKLLCEPVTRICWDERRLDLGYIPIADRTGFTLIGKDGKPLVDAGFSDLQQTKAGAILTRAGGESILFGAGAKEIIRFRGKASPVSDGLLRVTHGNEFGFLDEDGTFRIPMRRGVAKDFSAGLAAVSTDGKWGFIDKQGKTTIAENWDEVRDFREDRAAVRRGTLWGCIDRMGAVVASPRWTDVGDFSFERAAVTESDLKSRTRQWSFIDRSGQVAFALDASDYVYSMDSGFPKFVQGRLRVYRRGTGLIRLDTNGLESSITGSETIEAPWSFTHEPRRPSYVSRYGGRGGANVLLNKLGSELMPDVNPEWIQHSTIFPYSTPPKFGLADYSGNVLVQPQWDETEVISPDWVWFRKGNQCGLANAKGRIVIAPEWDELEVMSVDSASFDHTGSIVMNAWGKRIFAPWVRVRKGNKVVILQCNGQPAMPKGLEADYVDFYGTGHVVIRQREVDGTPSWHLYEPATGVTTSYPNASALRWNWSVAQSGVLWFQHKIDRKWYLSNVKGELLGHSQNAMPLSWLISPDGYGILKEDGGNQFLVDKMGMRLGNESWQNIQLFSEGRAAVSRDNKWGFIDRDGKVVCRPQWDGVGSFRFGMASVFKAGRWGFIGMDGTLMVEPVWDNVLPFEECWMPRRAESPTARWIFAKVAISGRWGAIAPSGLLLIDPKYPSHWDIGETEVVKGIESTNAAPVLLPSVASASTQRPELTRPPSELQPRVILDKPIWGYTKLNSGTSGTVE